MAVLAVDYDLRERGPQDYPDLIAALKRFASWCHVLQSSWLVETDATPQQVGEYLKPYLGSTDRLFVKPVVLSASWSQGLPKDVLNWLQAKYHEQRAKQVARSAGGVQRPKIGARSIG